MSNYPLFSVIGLEIEYMLVDKDSLNVVPKSDVLLQALSGGEITNQAELGDIALSNELVMHVIELKNNGPKPLTRDIVNHFQQAILHLQPLLQEHRLQLLPTGAHPWMNPATETKRWPHGNRDIYQKYDSLFNCEGHGWANLQSMHVNLPFANDEEFFQLHSAIRIILPLLPALAASTPFLDGQYSGMQDTRLYYYDKNQQRIPSISGDVIPEFIKSPQHYQETILHPMYEAIRPFDTEGILQYEWLNSRAAIPKFEYGALEIRIIDSQECVNADFAIAQVIVAVLKKWLGQSTYFMDKPCDQKPLRDVYQQSIHKGLNAAADNQELMKQWQLRAGVKTCRDVWAQLIETVSSDLDQQSQVVLENILSQGNLSERLLHACGQDHSKANLKRVYRQLSQCLLDNQPFLAS